MKLSWETIWWWEKRRLPFNAILLVIGLVSIFVVELIGSRWVKPGEDVEEPMGLVIISAAYGFAANVAYTLGWLSELLWRGVGDPPDFKLRWKIFWMGTTFSSVLTFAPAILFFLAWTIRGFK